MFVVKAFRAWQRPRGFLQHLLAGISPVCDPGQFHVGRGEHFLLIAWIWIFSRQCCAKSALFVLYFYWLFGLFASKP